MLKIIITCHVEPDKNGNIDYLPVFLEKIKKPIILLLQTGETAGDRILKYYSKNTKLFPASCRIGLHIHGDKFLPAINRYNNILGKKPENISFGHWKMEPKKLAQLEKLGIKRDFSYAAYKHNTKYFTKFIFDIQGITEFPVSCDPAYPINPLDSLYHLFLIVFLVLFSGNKLLHITFHSYDYIYHPLKSYFGLKLISLLPIVSYEAIS